MLSEGDRDKIEEVVNEAVAEAMDSRIRRLTRAAWVSLVAAAAALIGGGIAWGSLVTRMSNMEAATSAHVASAESHPTFSGQLDKFVSRSEYTAALAARDSVLVDLKTTVSRIEDKLDRLILQQAGSASAARSVAKPNAGSDG